MSLEYPRITSIFPIFTWKVCIKCGRECSREGLWQIDGKRSEDRNYVCKVCIPTIYLVKKFAKEKVGLSRRMQQQPTKIFEK